MWTMWTTSCKSRAHARCGQCGQSFFFCPLCPLSFCVVMTAWAFVDNVDIVGALFKLLAKRRTYNYYCLYIQYRQFFCLLYIYCPHCPHSPRHRAIASFPCGSYSGQFLVHAFTHIVHTSCKIRILANKCFTVLQSVKISLTIDTPTTER